MRVFRTDTFFFWNVFAPWLVEFIYREPMDDSSLAVLLITKFSQSVRNYLQQQAFCSLRETRVEKRHSRYLCSLASRPCGLLC